MSARVYALANQKGGVGKTTTAINMAACVAQAGTPVLLIDLDPQANATTGLGYRPEQLSASTYDLLHGRPLDEVVIETAVPNLLPVQCEYYALEGLAQLLQSVELVRTRINPRLGVTGVLLTMYDARTRLASDVASEVRSHFGPLVFDTVVPRSIRLAEAPSHGVPITTYDSSSAGADAYYRAALEVVERG